MGGQEWRTGPSQLSLFLGVLGRLKERMAEWRPPYPSPVSLTLRVKKLEDSAKAREGRRKEAKQRGHIFMYFN
jgi:hypothetical protein